jgi:hypothetical protein
MSDSIAVVAGDPMIVARRSPSFALGPASPQVV